MADKSHDFNIQGGRKDPGLISPCTLENMVDYTIRLLESPEDMTAAEELQRIVWPGSETDMIPAHLLITAIHNGGIVLRRLLRNHNGWLYFWVPRP